jgi:predicted ATPase
MAAGLSRVSLPYDPCVSGRAWLAVALAVLGYPDQAFGQSDRALADADKLGHHNTMCLVLSLRCSVGQLLRDGRDVARNADALLTVADEQGFAYWAGLGQYFRGWAQAWTGDTAAGVERSHCALEACRTTGAAAYVPYNVATLAELCLRAGDAARGRELLDMALGMLRATDARYCEAELLRLDGELRLTMPDPDQDGAEAAFRRALEIARGQEARIVELRVAMSLARLWADSGRRGQAHNLLASVYASFTEGFSTDPLVSAKRMIVALE